MKSIESIVEESVRARAAELGLTDEDLIQQVITLEVRDLRAASAAEKALEAAHQEHIAMFHAHDGVTECDGGCRW